MGWAEAPAAAGLPNGAGRGKLAFITNVKS